MKVKLELRKRDVRAKIQLGKDVIKNLCSNPFFTEVLPELEDLENTTNMLEKYWEEYNSVIQLPQIKLGQLATKETEFDQQITTLAFQVEKMSKGNSALIRSAGFSTRAPRKSGGIPPQVKELKISETDTEGCLSLKWKSIPGSKCYNIEISTNISSESNWFVVETTTRAKAVITLLKYETRYWFRVTAVGAAGKGIPSEPAAKYV